MDLGSLTGLTGIALRRPGLEDVWKGNLTRRVLKQGGVKRLDGKKADDVFYPAIAVEANGLWVVRRSATSSQLVRILREGKLDPKAPQPNIQGIPCWTQEGIIYQDENGFNLLRANRVRPLGNLVDFGQSPPLVTRWGFIRHDFRQTGESKYQTLVRLDPIR